MENKSRFTLFMFTLTKEDANFEMIHSDHPNFRNIKSFFDFIRADVWWIYDREENCIIHASWF